MGATKKEKSVKRPGWEQATQGPDTASKLADGPVLQQGRAGSGTAFAIDAAEDHRMQPWQSLLDEIERESSLSPPGSDLFPCQDGFYAHSLAG